MHRPESLRDQRRADPRCWPTRNAGRRGTSPELIIVHPARRRSSGPEVRDPLFFAAATAVFGIYGAVVIHHEGQGIEITSDNAWTLAAAIVFPPNLAFLIALVGYLPHQIARRRPWFKAGFNMAQAGLSAAATSQT